MRKLDELGSPTIESILWVSIFILALFAIVISFSKKISGVVHTQMNSTVENHNREYCDYKNNGSEYKGRYVTDDLTIGNFAELTDHQISTGNYKPLCEFGNGIVSLPNGNNGREINDKTVIPMNFTGTVGEREFINGIEKIFEDSYQIRAEKITYQEYSEKVMKELDNLIVGQCARFANAASYKAWLDGLSQSSAKYTINVAGVPTTVCYYKKDKNSITSWESTGTGTNSYFVNFTLNDQCEITSYNFVGKDYSYSIKDATMPIDQQVWIGTAVIK